MDARDELAKLLFVTDNSNAKDIEAEWMAAGGQQLGYIYDMVDAILAGGYVKYRIITTIEELDALPFGSMILDSDPDASRKNEDGSWTSVSSPKFPFASRIMSGSLPATVLYEPEVTE